MAQAQTESTTGQVSQQTNHGDRARVEEARSFRPGDYGRPVQALTRGEGIASHALEPLLAVQTVMDRWFDEMWGRMSGFGGLPAMRAARGLSVFGGGYGAPIADLKETDKAYNLSVELAGLSRDNIELTARGDQILLTGHKAEDREEGDGAWRLSERQYGRFERSFSIPDDVDPEKIAAAFKDGVLKITLPKSTDSKVRGSRIEIR